MPNPDDDVIALAALLRAARRVVVFTGAGISTESGIPDFRSPGGIWTKMMPVEFRDYIRDPEARRVSWERRFEMEDTWNAVRPNDGHRAVAELVAMGKVSHVITQNIDALHQASGVPEEQVIELHGNTRYAKCLDCGVRMEISDIRAHFHSHGAAPDCLDCGGIVKTATISFGQPMPEDEMTRAEAATLACDLMLVLGSSLAVYPAAGFPLLARKMGAGLAIVNREETPQDDYADLVVNAEIGPTVRAVIDAL
ncbi:MAG: NAD-dependent deacetylase [Alphaproteobacteria bacterium]|nr:NAD-dependent deacetylase [Alphaproteobacteria bacterium]MDB5741099.1 NAD-dependent deacetylase [Alphaproteobacteria bacterium]